MKIEITREHTQINAIAKMVRTGSSQMKVVYDNNNIPYLAVQYGGRQMVRSIRFNSIEANVKVFSEMLFSVYENAVLVETQDVVFLDDILANEGERVTTALKHDYRCLVNMEDYING